MLTGKIIRDKKKFKQAIENKTPFIPLFIKLKLMWDCNLKCKMCNHWRSQSPSLPVEFFNKVISELSSMGCKRIHITGGEPMLYEDIFVLMRNIKKHNIRVTMTTNATLLKEHTVKELVYLGLNQVNVSIDSPIENIHDEVRGIEKSFQRASRGIKLLRQFMPNGLIQINMVVSQYNYKTVNLLPELVAEMGGNRICLIPVKKTTNDIQNFSKEEIQEYNEKIAPETWKKASALNLVHSPSQIFIFGQNENEITQSTLGLYAQGYYDTHPCYAMWTHALIDHNGLVSPCCFSTRNPIIGDLKEKSFSEIWNSEEYQKLRTQNHAPLEDCKKCTMFIPKNKEIEEAIYKENTIWEKFKGLILQKT